MLNDKFEGFLIVELGNYRKALKKGHTINDVRLEMAFRLMRQLKDTSLTDKFDIISINATNVDSISFYMDEVSVIIGRDKYKDKLVLLKELVSNKFNNKISDLRSIDLRFASSIENIYCIPR